MKTRFQRLISLVLALVMLVTMIPAGIFTANAVVSAELSAGLADYDNTAEFVINSVEDWEAVAATTYQFDGKTVKLGADIDAGGATLPQLFQANNVRTTLDGQGYAIKNVGTAENPNPTSLLSWKANLNVQNVTVDNCHVSGEGNKGILVDWQNCWGKYIFKNIKVLDSSVVATGNAGAVVGYMTTNGNNYGVDFENILVSGTSIEGNAGVAALIGYTYLNNGDYGVAAKNVEVTDTTITDNTAASCAAGLFGSIRCALGTILDVQNCYVNATFVTPNSSGWTGVATALFQTKNSYVSNNNKVTVKNCITNCTYSLSVVQSTTLFYAKQAIFETENLYAVQNIGKSGMVIDSNSIVNGVTVESSYNGVEPELLNASDLPFMIARDENGFIKSVGLIVNPDLDLENYDTTLTFVIDSVDDWNLIANSGLTFAGKTIKLGADIDFGGAEAKPLVPASLGATTMKFDGQGYAIKNANATAPLIAGILTATGTGGNPGSDTEFSAAATVKNVTFEGITLTAEGDAALAVGTLTGNSMDFVFENIKVLDCDITSTAGKAAAIAVAQEYGTAGSYNRSSFKATNVTIDADTTITAKTFAAGVLAYAAGYTNSYQTFTNVYVAATITSSYDFVAGTAAKYSAAAAGIVGYVAGSSGRGVTMSFTNCVVAGSLLLSSATTADHGAVGGLYAILMGGHGKIASVTVNNVAINLVDFTNVSTRTGSLGYVNNSKGFILVMGTVYVKNAPVNEFYDEYGIMYLGSEAEENLVSGTKKNLETLQNFSVEFDENGFLTAIVPSATCTHDWTDANCTTPKTCTLCGTTEGESLGHDWKDETCTVPSTCVRCGITLGTALGHNYGDWVIVREATASSIGIHEKTCSRCGDVVREYYSISDSVIVIGSVEDWLLLAASGETFAGKTIMLSADLDFGGMEIPTLVPASLGATTMKFDGQGYKIMNGTASAPLIAGILTATGTSAGPADKMDPDFSNEIAYANRIENVTFENVTLTAADSVALIAGTLTGNSMDFIFENIKVINCVITSTAGDAAALFVTHERGTGGSWNRSIVSIKNVTIDANTTITAADNAGGLFADALNVTHGVYSFENIYMAATVKSVYEYETIDDPNTEENENTTHETGAGRVGGLFAYSENVNVNSNRCNTYLFKNVAVVGSLLSENGKIYDGTLGGLYGYAGGVGTFNVENVVIDLVEYTAKQNFCYSFGMIQGYTAVISYKNVYVGNAPATEFMNGNSSVVNGEEVSGGTIMNLPTVPITPEQHDDVILCDENGFVVEIKEYIPCDHVWTDATCLAPKTCTLCGVTEGEPNVHTEEILLGYYATCTEYGLSDGVKCSVCHEILVAQEVIPALGHEYENGTCIRCGEPKYLVGDLDNDGDKDSDDAVYLLNAIMFGTDLYPVNQPMDFNGDSKINSDDSVYLLYNVFFGDDDYPLGGAFGDIIVIG